MKVPGELTERAREAEAAEEALMAARVPALEIGVMNWSRGLVVWPAVWVFKHSRSDGVMACCH